MAGSVTSVRAGSSIVEERAVRFGRSNNLVGVVTRPLPESSADGIPVLILGAGIVHKVGPSRVSVELARRLARAGHVVLRFDLGGIGDSGRPHTSTLEESVQHDIEDAVTALVERAGSGPVATVGFCSGADNGLYMADVDDRIVAVAMSDPTVHRTRGFHTRKLMARVTSRRSWANVLSGRSLRLRLAGGAAEAAPPGYYGLLSAGADETDERVGRLVARGVKLLYCIGSGAHQYCNSPTQVEESLPRSFSPDHIAVEWLPTLDHIFSDPGPRGHFVDVVTGWLAGLDPEGP